MKRSAELAPLSRDHHVALEVALRLRRADEATVAQAAERFRAFFADDGERHFAQEEELLVPELPDELARRVRDEHAEVRRRAAELARQPTPDAAHALGELLAAHVRFEEREAFPLLERRLPPERLAALGARLAR